jgi:hypothetical protein
MLLLLLLLLFHFLLHRNWQILSVFQEKNLICEEVQRFEDLLMQQREVFAEEEIKNSFPKLISFVLEVGGPICLSVDLFLSLCVCVCVCVCKCVRECWCRYQRWLHPFLPPLLSFPFLPFPHDNIDRRRRC